MRPSTCDDQTWDEAASAGIRNRKAEATARLKNLESSLSSLKFQDSDFAAAHRKLIALDRDIIAVIERHESA